jgi:hypothetical protein
MSRELETTKAPETGAFMVGDTGIEPVTPTVSMSSRGRWLPIACVGSVGFRGLRCWLSWLAMVCFGCGVAPVWPTATLLHVLHQRYRAPGSPSATRRDASIISIVGDRTSEPD